MRQATLLGGSSVLCLSLLAGPEHRALANSLHEYVTNLVSIKHRDANLAAVLQQLLLDARQGNNQYSC